jgi:hypothetical protein
MILTNGQVWQVWHLTAGMPVELTMALEADLLGEGGPTQKADVLFYLSKEAFKRRVIGELWRVRPRRQQSRWDWSSPATPSSTRSGRS